ncbi:hypothetical protein IQ06DRAFT_333575 [Phaeosphaeriaceae sp. SRC1lsM3a]|nr:hypothetical protein IQ06DRAFT_333575 [Stagonospora sp. SRC1lsM3a]
MEVLDVASQSGHLTLASPVNPPTGGLSSGNPGTSGASGLWFGFGGNTGGATKSGLGTGIGAEGGFGIGMIPGAASAWRGSRSAVADAQALDIAPTMSSSDECIIAMWLKVVQVGGDRSLQNRVDVFGAIRPDRRLQVHSFVHYHGQARRRLCVGA